MRRRVCAILEKSPPAGPLILAGRVSPGEACGSQNKEKYPVVFFHRGSNGYQKYNNEYNSWLAKVAGQGLIVVAPVTGCANTDPYGCPYYRKGCFEDEDLKIAYDAAPKMDIYGMMDLDSVRLRGNQQTNAAPPPQ